MPPGCCFVITRRQWVSLNGFDEQFEFLHGEDVDLFTRATKMGIDLIQCDTTVRHKRGATRFLLPDCGVSTLQVNLKKWAMKHMTDDVREQKGDMYLPKLSNAGGLQ
jgi:GT2 family glycosyltransferase